MSAKLREFSEPNLARRLFYRVAKAITKARRWRRRIAYGQPIKPAPGSLSEVPERDLNLLKKRIINANGRVIVLIHPFYGAQGKKYDEARTALLNQTHTPVVILEEQSKVAQTQDRLKQLKAPRHFIIPTQNEGSHVILDAHELKLDSRNTQLARTLRNAGAQTILVGGIHATHSEPVPPEKHGWDWKILSNWDFVRELYENVLNYEKSWMRGRRADNKKVTMIGCAGVAYSFFVLSKQFKTVRLIPAALFPEKPAYLTSKQK